MGWGKFYFLGATANRMDIEVHEQQIARMRRKLTRASHGDRSRDESLAMLMAENALLKRHLACLVDLLVEKGAFSEEELASAVALADQKAKEAEESDDDDDGPNEVRFPGLPD